MLIVMQRRILVGLSGIFAKNRWGFCERIFCAHLRIFCALMQLLFCIFLRIL